MTHSATSMPNDAALTLPRRSVRALVLHGVEHLGAEPAPVDVVGGDASVGEFDDLVDVDWSPSGVARRYSHDSV
jgi:hypothetical protein